ncbi:hypothetical protein TNCV_5130821 [Trichonephila clavipes]|nr:hypothetical protein TNCV_5130821 [Trichonephila clavipes]
MLHPIRHAFSKFLQSGTANREVTHPVPPTNHSACFQSPAHSKLPWFPPQTLTSSPLLRLATTSVSTIFQPANQVAPYSPFRTIPLPQATFTIHVMGRRNAPRSMSQ